MQRYKNIINMVSQSCSPVMELFETEKGLK